MNEIDAILSAMAMTYDEALRYFKGRVPVTAKEFYQIAADYRTLAFTVSGYTKAEIIKQFQKALTRAIEDGDTIAGFRATMREFLRDYGYKGPSSFQAENIFRTNVQTAYNVGHYNRMTEPGVIKARPYWQYDAVNDSKTRPSHLAMDGRVFPADSQVWDTWYPPNGFKCRCTVRSLSERQVKDRGLKVETEAPRGAVLPDGRAARILPDPHFQTNPAKVQFIPNLTGWPEPIVKAYQQWKGKKVETP